MSINHRIGEHVTRYLVGRDYDVADVQCAKVCYAVESIVGDLQKDLVLFVIFAVSGFFREFLFCFVTVNLVRRFLGGIHMKTNIGCTVASVSVYVIAVAGGVHVIFPYPVVAGLLLFTMYLMATIAPLPSPNRPVYKGERKKKIQQKGLIGLGVLSICTVIYPACSTFVALILILQIVEVGVVVFRENYLNYKDMDAPPSMSEEAEKLFMECTRNYEARMNEEKYPIGIVGFYLRASIGLPAGNWLPLCNSYDRIFRAGWIRCHLTVPDHLLLLKHP